MADFKDFPQFGRILGIDWGARRIGVAVSDESQEFVWPRPGVSGQAPACAGVTGISKIIDVIGVEKAIAIVIGLPLRLDGTESNTTLVVRRWVAELEKFTDLPIFFCDESLSSYVASENIGKKQNLDSESAKIILENAIAMARRTAQ